LVVANIELSFQNTEKEKRASELIIANKELNFQNNEKEKRASELIIANKELNFQNNEKEKRASELVVANIELNFQNNEKEKRASELVVANKELIFQNDEKEKRASELVVANIELNFQYDEKEKRASELKIANIELSFQNIEKEKRAAELVIANKELSFQNNEKEKRASELVIANIELAFQNEEKEKRASELVIANIQKEAEEKYKHIIEEKNKNITNSIKYSKRIQEAKLPPKEKIYASLPQSFILFKPKDIVSGDFYFFHENNKSVFIVAADCTGHGVPGALMSMIGSDKLSVAFAQSTDTSEILRQLNISIKNSLHQSDEYENDGMEIAICSINTETRIVKFAGARRPLWLIRNGNSEIEEIKGTKSAIGGYTEDSQYYESHILELEKGDTFYIFSDGYADAFNWTERKRLTTKVFKQILIEIQVKTMQQQEQILNSFIEEWKSGSDQVDDILVIGVRL